MLWWSSPLALPRTNLENMFLFNISIYDYLNLEQKFFVFLNNSHFYAKTKGLEHYHKNKQ